MRTPDYTLYLSDKSAFVKALKDYADTIEIPEPSDEELAALEASMELEWIIRDGLSIGRESTLE